MKTIRTLPRPYAGLLLTSIVCLTLATRADTLELLWDLKPGDRTYFTTGNTERGMAYNPVSNRVLVVSRAGGLHVFVLNAETGAELHELYIDTSVVTGGTFAINMIGITEEGVVYVGNLSTSTTAPYFKLYRWANDDPGTPPTIAYEGDPANGGGALRWGDSLDVRGSGTNVQVVVPSRNTAHMAILTTTDGFSFTSTVVPGVGNTTGNLGVAFGEDNTIWNKLNNASLIQSSFDLATATATNLHKFGSEVFPAGIAPLAVDPVKKQLAGLAFAPPGSISLYDLTDQSSAPVLLDSETLPVSNANGNGVGSVDFGPDRVFVLNANNGLQAYKIIRPNPNEPPVIDAQPASLEVLEGGLASFSVTVRGGMPMFYQWNSNNVAIPDATNATLMLAQVQPSFSGDYSVTITNVGGSVTSSNAALTVTPLVRSDNLTRQWKLAPGDKPWLSDDNNQRGLAYNPVNGHVLVVSRTGGTGIYVLNGTNGAELDPMTIDTSVVTGGTFTLNLVGVADDGVVYACNLVTGGTGFRIYRWDNDSTNALPMTVYDGDPANGANTQRWGDNFAVRGQGANTQILAASRNGTVVALFTTLDGYNFIPTLIDTTDATPGNFGTCIVFGETNTFWGKAPGSSLRQVSFDPTTAFGTTLLNYDTNQFPAGVSAIALDFAHDFLAGVAVENPDNVRLYDITDPSQPPVLKDQELTPTDNVNGNSTAAMAFGGGMLFALDSNNGIIAFTVKKIAAAPRLLNPYKTATHFGFNLKGEAGQSYGIETSSDLTTWKEVVSETATNNLMPFLIPTGDEPYLFYRARAK